MHWSNKFSVFRYLQSRQIAKALSLNSVVLNGLKSNYLNPVHTPLNGECCVLSIWLEDIHAEALDTLSADDYVGALEALKAEIFRHLNRFPAVVSISQGLCIQALFMSQFSEQEFALSAAQAAEELIGLIETFKVANHGFSDDGEAYRVVRVKMGLALGQVNAQFVKVGSGYECLASGQAVTLSRLLSADRHRYGMPVLLDQATGRLIEKARSLGLYRTPGFSVEYVLYGLQTSQPTVLEQAFKDTFTAALAFLYDPNSNDPNSLEKANESFEKCLSVVPEDKPGKQMLDKIQPLLRDKQKTSSPKIRGFFAV